MGLRADQIKLGMKVLLKGNSQGMLHDRLQHKRESICLNARCGYPGIGSTRELFSGLCRSCRMIVSHQSTQQEHHLRLELLIKE